MQDKHCRDHRQRRRHSDCTDEAHGRRRARTCNVHLVLMDRSRLASQEVAVAARSEHVGLQLEPERESRCSGRCRTLSLLNCRLLISVRDFSVVTGCCGGCGAADVLVTSLHDHPDRGPQSGRVWSITAHGNPPRLYQPPRCHPADRTARLIGPLAAPIGLRPSACERCDSSGRAGGNEDRT